MDTTFAPAAVEPRWRARWQELGVGHADPRSGRPAFVIALPPPNITAELHLGHAAGSTVQDVLARWRRMCGDEVEWCPGSDHAAIATQNVIERQLASEGTSKEQLGRVAFAARVDEWYRTMGGRIFEQMRALGFTCDWERSRFTLDDAYVRSIRTVFRALYDQGLIYRGPRIVNWCPTNLSAISDEEVRWREHEDTLVRLRYPIEGGGDIEVATVRPETMLGDSAVAVSPGDPRYESLVGRTVILPLTGRRVPIVADPRVEREFGTGALKVTPAHDPLDYEIGQRHGLPLHSVIAPDGTLDVPDLPRFHGLSVVDARREVTAALREVGAVTGEEPYVHDVGHCDRCDAVLEPLISEQWWVRMAELAAPAISAVEEGRVRFHPDRPNTEVYLAWMRNIRDWCISRQLWLGHAIPASTCASGHTIVWVDRPSTCTQCGSTDLTDDPDVLDTWFSSALWPFAIFGWPETTADLRRFYPTSVLVTAREIIFLWVARMIMTGIRFMGVEPFTHVIINSTIQAADGTRMSKSRGNGVDPLAMIELYGTDAVRAWGAAMGTAGQDMRFDEARMEAYRSFANKLWNVTRLLHTRLAAGAPSIPPVTEPPPSLLRPEDRWLLSKVATTLAAVDAAMNVYRFHEALERMYATTWDTYCSTWVETAKARLSADDPAAAWTATTALDVILRMLHPFMPFVTEECAQRLPGAAPTLQHRQWPVAPAWWREAHAEETDVDRVLDLASAIRARRQDAEIPARVVVECTVTVVGGVDRPLLQRVLEPLARVRVEDALPAGADVLRVVAGGLEAALAVAQPDTAGDLARLRRELADAEGRVASVRARLGTPAFVEKAPRAVVDGARAQLDEAEGRVATLRRILGETSA